MANSNAFSESLARINAKESNNRRVEAGMKTNKMFTNKGIDSNPTTSGGINRPTKPTRQK